MSAKSQYHTHTHPPFLPCDVSSTHDHLFSFVYNSRRRWLIGHNAILTRGSAPNRFVGPALLEGFQSDRDVMSASCLMMQGTHAGPTAAEHKQASQLFSDPHRSYMQDAFADIMISKQQQSKQATKKKLQQLMTGQVKATCCLMRYAKLTENNRIFVLCHTPFALTFLPWHRFNA